jgi:uncharacterized protein YjdB
MLTIRRARGLAAVLPFVLASGSCRDIPEPTGLGRVAPTRAQFAIAPTLPAAVQGEPVIPVSLARIRLFRLPGETPERAIVDTVVPFGDADLDRTLTIPLVLTMVSESFGVEVTLLDERVQVIYRARDTLVAYTTTPPEPTAIQLAYAGPDTVVGRITLQQTTRTLLIGDRVPVSAQAFRRDGSVVDARFGFAVRGSSAITLDEAGRLRASAPVAAGSAWLVARIATGLADSIALEALMPAAAIALTPSSPRMTVGTSIALAAVARDAGGAVLAGRRLDWSSSNPGVASVVDGVVTGNGVGTALITARAQQASDVVAITVVPSVVRRVVPSVSVVGVRAGRIATVSATALDSVGGEVTGRIVSWRVEDGKVASVLSASSVSNQPVQVRALTEGTTTLVATIEGVTSRLTVNVGPAPAARVQIQTRPRTLLVGETLDYVARVFDSSGVEQPGRVMTWSSLNPASAVVSADGAVRVLATGAAAIVASIEGVADTAAAPVRIADRLFINPTVTMLATHLGSTVLRAFALEADGRVIDELRVVWRVAGPATLSSAGESSVRVATIGTGRVTVTAIVVGLTAAATIDSPSVGAVTHPPVPVPVPASPAGPGHSTPGH